MVFLNKEPMKEGCSMSAYVKAWCTHTEEISRKLKDPWFNPDKSQYEGSSHGSQKINKLRSETDGPGACCSVCNTTPLNVSYSQEEVLR